MSQSVAPRSRQTFSTGSETLNRWLPGNGLPADALTEWVGETNGGGASTLALVAASGLLVNDSPTSHSRSSPTAVGPLVIFDSTGTFYPPAARALGISPERLILCRPRSHADLVWSIDQALRCAAVAAVFSWVDGRLNDRDARRLQLAAESGRTPGLLVRPASVRHRPTFAETRFHVASEYQKTESSPANAPESGEASESPIRRGDRRTFQVTLDRCRGATLTGSTANVQLDSRGQLHSIGRPADHSVGSPPDHSSSPTVALQAYHETATLHLASQLAHPTPKKRAAKVQRRRA
ncbi:MAG: hypothetical protein AAGA03_16305 [Planctomycetota bacterium]